MPQISFVQGQGEDYSTQLRARQNGKSGPPGGTYGNAHAATTARGPSPSRNSSAVRLPLCRRPNGPPARKKADGLAGLPILHNRHIGWARFPHEFRPTTNRESCRSRICSSSIRICHWGASVFRTKGANRGLTDTISHTREQKGEICIRVHQELCAVRQRRVPPVQGGSVRRRRFLLYEGKHRLANGPRHQLTRTADNREINGPAFRVWITCRTRLRTGLRSRDVQSLSWSFAVFILSGGLTALLTVHGQKPVSLWVGRGYGFKTDRSMNIAESLRLG